MKEGKRGISNQYKDKPLNSNIEHCDICNGELIKLETMLGEVEIKNNKFYRPLYWVSSCVKCDRICKVFDCETEVNNYIVGKPNNRIHKLREL